MTISESVKLNLMRKGMTQEALAKELEVTPMTISRKLSNNSFRKAEVSHMRHVLKFEIVCEK